VAALSSHFDTRGMMDLIFTIGNYVMFSSILNGMRVQPEAVLKVWTSPRNMAVPDGRPFPSPAVCGQCQPPHASEVSPSPRARCT